ncbi:tetratricopeptide repeat protein [Actinokineospora iranica]|uniref:Tetratricopeptide repeat-containing protein n=1 Tax=Actinokineospora iranica TaxID=1271860 RepID=A0A1G6VBK1_9PSEU|nr:tetratricopeptide repeat protein [Actinokineospora iranica]SDD50834.1 Tetratricopeptide repeat-containing protein [Actinokineospora iranica]
MAESVDAVLVEAAQLTASGKPEAAIALLRPILVVHPDHSGAWCRLSAALLDAGDPQLCLDAAKRAITLGERSWAHRLASLALAEMGRLDEAVVSAREAARRDPDDWRAHVALAEVLAHESPDEALAAATRAVEVAPEVARAHEILGAAAVRVRDIGLAKRAYADAVRLDPTNADVRAELARLGGPRPQRVAIEPLRRPEPMFGRAERITLWLVLRRCAGWLTAGSVVLMVAALPQPSPLLAWFALALLLTVVGLAGAAVLATPSENRLPPRELARRVPLLAAGAVLLALGLFTLAIWAVALALGALGTHLLVPALVLALCASAVGWFGLWRMRSFAR